VQVSVMRRAIVQHAVEPEEDESFHPQHADAGLPEQNRCAAQPASAKTEDVGELPRGSSRLSSPPCSNPRCKGSLLRNSIYSGLYRNDLISEGARSFA